MGHGSVARRSLRGAGTYWRQTPSDILATRHIGDKRRSRRIGDTFSFLEGDGVGGYEEGLMVGKNTSQNLLRVQNLNLH